MGEMGWIIPSVNPCVLSEAILQVGEEPAVIDGVNDPVNP
jgi:hypothetical protein